MSEKKFNCLVLCRDQEDVYKFDSIQSHSGDMKKIFKDHSVTCGHFDEFIQGIFHNTFDFIIISLSEEDLSGEDLDMQQDCIEHYSKAPVLSWSLSSGNNDNLKSKAKSLHATSECDFFAADSEEERAGSFVKLFNWSVSTYNKKCKDEVEKVFT